MKYVSAEWIPPAYEGGTGTIKAIGDDGIEYFIPSMDCDVPPWPDYLAEGGTVTGYETPVPQETEDATGPAVEPEQTE